MDQGQRGQGPLAGSNRRAWRGGHGIHTSWWSWYTYIPAEYLFLGAGVELLQGKEHPARDS